MTPTSNQRLAAVCRVPGARRTAEWLQASHAAPLAPESAAPPTGLGLPLVWPAGQPARWFGFDPLGADPPTMPGATARCGLWCTEAWWRDVGATEMAIDLAGASSPADWLERIENRLLEQSITDPGPYAALAHWSGDLPDDV